MDDGDRLATIVTSWTALLRSGDTGPLEDVRAAGGPRSLVFVFDQGKIVRMESFSDREAAFAALE